MLCENCNQKDATSIYMPPNSGKIVYLCGACYRKLNNDTILDEMVVKEIDDIKIEQRCNGCGQTYAEFKASGVFGCEDCYASFSDVINEFVGKFKQSRYTGKKPNIFYIQKEIKNLEQMVEICLKNGNLQQATKYGVEIQKLKEQCYGKL